jgi:undecaprenyl-diphosphatase
VLINHRRAFWWSVGLLASTVFVFAAVGRHPPGAAPATTLPFAGDWDLATYRAMEDIRNEPFTALARLLSVLGSGVVTIPLRFLVAVWLLARTRWRAFAAWVLTWGVSEFLVATAKGWFHRGRAPGALVETVGYSFPSGHAVTGAATAVALVLVLFPPGPSRRRWEVAAVGFAFVMAFSRVYLLAHWLSDVVAGVLLGTGIALGCAALVTEVRDLAMARRGSVEGSGRTERAPP